MNQNPLPEGIPRFTQTGRRSRGGAQNLNEYDDKTRLMGAGFEWLRALPEEGGFALAFCGDMSLAPTVGDMPQPASRLRRPLTLKGVGKGDVARFAESIRAAIHAEGLTPKGGR